MHKLHDSTSLTHYLPPPTITDLWHDRYAHLNYVYLHQAFKKCWPIRMHNSMCSSCIKEKQYLDPFTKNASRKVSQSLKLVHMDWCKRPCKRPMQNILVVGANKYFMFILDDFNRLNWVFFLKQKIEAFISSKQWCRKILETK